jgi:FkbM family methyltransferase
MIRKLIRKAGFDIVRYPYLFTQRQSLDKDLISNRLKLLKHFEVDLVLDVGANEGQYGKNLRKNGFEGKIISFEPLPTAFEVLSKKAQDDGLWEVNNFALGETIGELSFNVAGNSVSSSFLEMENAHTVSAPESRYVTSRVVPVKTLDLLFEKYTGYKKIYLKLDVQGFERHVLNGVSRHFHMIKGIQIEMSLIPLYKGEETFFEFSKFLLDAGFQLKSLEPGFFDSKTGQLLQVDGIWFR